MTLETIGAAELRHALQHYDFGDEMIDKLFEAVELITNLPPGAVLTKVEDLGDLLDLQPIGCEVKTISKNEELRIEGRLNAYHVNQSRGPDPQNDRDPVDTQLVVDGRFLVVHGWTSIVVYPIDETH